MVSRNSTSNRIQLLNRRDEREEHADFLRFLPAVELHAKIQFRNLPASEQEEAIAEAVAAAFSVYVSARRRGRLARLKPASLARFAVLHVRDGGHVGGSRESARDTLSWRSQRQHDFIVHRLGHVRDALYDCLSPNEHPVWRLALLSDRRTPVVDQVRFRMDWSRFLSGQSDRTRQIVALLADGHRRTDVAEQFGTSASALTQRTQRLRRHWERFQHDAREPV